MVHYIYRATISKVIDGDTLDVTIDLGFKISHTIRLTLKDIDTEEINSKSELALKAKEFLKQYESCAVFIETHKVDKYQRYVAVVKLCNSETTLNDMLVAEGLAKKV